MPSGAWKHGSIPTSQLFFSSYPWHLEILYPVSPLFPQNHCCFNSYCTKWMCVCFRTTYDTNAIMAYPALMEKILYKDNKQYIVQRHYIIGPHVEPRYSDLKLQMNTVIVGFSLWHLVKSANKVTNAWCCFQLLCLYNDPHSILRVFDCPNHTLLFNCVDVQNNIPFFKSWLEKCRFDSDISKCWRAFEGGRHGDLQHIYHGLFCHKINGPKFPWFPNHTNHLYCWTLFIGHGYVSIDT